MIPYDKLCECFRIVRELTPKYREEFEEALTRLRALPSVDEAERESLRYEYEASRAGPLHRLKVGYYGNHFVAAYYEPGLLPNDEPEKVDHPADAVVMIAKFIRDKQRAEHWIEIDLDVFDHMCMELLTGPTLKHAVQEAARDVSIVGDQERSDQDEGPVEELGA